MALQLEQIDDYVVNVLDYFLKDEYVNLTIQPQHKTAKRFFDKAMSKWQSGAKFNWKIKVATAGNARVTQLYDQDSTNIVNTFVEGEVPWSHYTSNFAYDLREESFLGGPQEIVDYLESNARDMYEDLWDVFEIDIWSKPTDVSQTPRPLYGIPTWVVTNGAVPDGAFNGGNPSGFPGGPAGVDLTIYERGNNWTFAHDGIADATLIDRIVKAMDFTKFVPTHPFPNAAPPNENDMFSICTTYAMRQEIGRYLRSQNDNLGPDAGTYLDGTGMIRGNVAKWVPQLDEQGLTGPGDGNDPIYLLNHRGLQFAKRRGWWMKRSAPKEGDGHTTRVVHLDCDIASVALDRSQQAVGARTS